MRPPRSYNASRRLSADTPMRLRPEQIGVHLSKTLAPLYVIHGDEILLIQETAAAIRDGARRRGYSERECLTVDAKFDWNSLALVSDSLSLFARRRLLEIRLDTAKPGPIGAKALTAYAKRPAEDVVLLVVCGKLEPAAQKSAWFLALEQAGVVIQIWPVKSSQLSAWIEQRMGQWGLRPTREACELLVQHVEGNLLAAAQEIDKLHILFGTDTVSARQLLAVIGDSARYSIYDLADAALGQQAERVVRILRGLQSEGVATVLVAWALHREIRLLALLNFAIGRGASEATALAQNKVWEQRKPLVRQARRRLPTPACQRLLQQCARVDRVIKGVDAGNPWDELLRLSLGLAGKNLLASSLK